MVIDPKVVSLYVTACCSDGNPRVEQVARQLIPAVDAIIAGFLGWSPSLQTYTETLPGEKTPARKSFGIDFGPGSMNGVTLTGTGNFSGADGNQLPVIILGKRPVRTITSVHSNPAAYQANQAGEWPAETLQDPSTYYLDFSRPGSPGLCKTGKVFRRFGGWWESMPRTVRVVYTAGLTAEELAGEFADIGAAYGLTLSAWVAKVLAAQSVGASGTAGIVAGKPVASVSVKDFSVSFAQGQGAGQFAAGTGGNSGGSGAAIPDEAVALLARHVSMSKWLNR